MLLPFTVAVFLAQSPTAAEVSAEKAAVAAQKAAESAERAAEAIQRIADAVAPRPPPAPPLPPTPAPIWLAKVGLGLTYLTGNTVNLTLVGNLAVERTWDVWALALRISGAYGLSNPSPNDPASATSTTSRRAAATLRGDRSFGGGFASLFLLAGSEFDHVKNIESRSIGEVGTGLTFFNQHEADLEKLFLKLDLALRGGLETRYQYFPVAAPVDPYTLAILAPRAAITFRWSFNRDVHFSEELEFIPFLLAPDAGRLLINNNTKLSARLTETIFLTTGVLINYDSKTPQTAGGVQRVSTDVALTVGVETTL